MMVTHERRARIRASLESAPNGAMNVETVTDRAKIDAAFAVMANDPDYLAEAEAICREFEFSDWEALRIAEKEMGVSDA